MSSTSDCGSERLGAIPSYAHKENMPKGIINKRREGRPTLYNEDILVRTQDYIDSCEDKQIVMTRPAIKEGKVVGEEQYTKWIVNMPTIEGLSFHLRIHKDTVQEWRKIYPEFSVLIGTLLDKQARALVNNGLSGDYNPTIAKVLLTKHGYREGIDATTNDKDLVINTTDPKMIELAQKYEEELKKGLS